jgi:hypothetical protein
MLDTIAAYIQLRRYRKACAQYARDQYADDIAALRNELLAFEPVRGPREVTQTSADQ